ncbi:hypothetical protein BHE74_00038230 [Ensete ventricosum]|nr:hypothetical protein BHE74_00038230 [Ensete ventricosum]
MGVMILLCLDSNSDFEHSSQDSVSSTDKCHQSCSRLAEKPYHCRPWKNKQTWRISLILSPCAQFYTFCPVHKVRSCVHFVASLTQMLGIFWSSSNDHWRNQCIDRSMAKDVEAGGRGEYAGKDYTDPPPEPLVDAEELTKWSLYRAAIAEFVATMLFLYVTVATVIGYKHQSDPAVNPTDAACSGAGILGIAWAFGGMIFILVYCTAGISGLLSLLLVSTFFPSSTIADVHRLRSAGGHINPAVTLGLFLARKISLVRALLYMIAQCLGAICGVGLVKGFQSAYYVRYGGGANELSDGYSKGTGLVAEIIGTFVLVYTVFSATDPKRNARDSHVPVVFMVHLATIPITGTGINPARSFGAAVIYNKDKAWDDQVQLSLDFMRICQTHETWRYDSSKADFIYVTVSVLYATCPSLFASSYSS